jgi:4-hydroxy-3-methylbut-2-enyl diphosphate reductase
MHPEIIGTAGHLFGSAVIIENEKDAFSCPIPENTKKITYLTQTTLSPDDVFPITSILKKRYKYLMEPEKNDICYATLERQKAVKDIAQYCEYFFIIGSLESSNSKRLREIVQKEGVKTKLINSWQEISTDCLKNIRSVGLSAGASAPDILLNETVDFLKTKGFQKIIDSKNLNFKDHANAI